MKPPRMPGNPERGLLSLEVSPEAQHLAEVLAWKSSPEGWRARSAGVRRRAKARRDKIKAGVLDSTCGRKCPAGCEEKLPGQPGWVHGFTGWRRCSTCRGES